MTKRSVLMITSGLGVGGSELQLVQLAIGLHQRRWDVGVLSMQPRGAYARKLTSAGIDVTEIPVARVPNPRSLCLLRSAVRNARADIIHTQAFRANLWGRLVGFSMDIPVVASIRATYSYIPRIYYPIERWMAVRSAAIITPSNATAQHLIDQVGVQPNRIVTIRNGVDTALFAPDRDTYQARERWKFKDRFVVLMPGRLSPQKDHATLIDAFAEVSRNYPGALLVIAGAGPLERDLRLRATGLGSAIRFVGELDRESIADIISASDVVCLATRFEGSPNVLLEAMASARPVVATAVDGIPELVLDGVNGFLVKPQDPAGLANALSRLAQSPELRTDLGGQGRYIAVREHRIDRNTERHSRLYEIVWETGSAHPRDVGVGDS